MNRSLTKRIVLSFTVYLTLAMSVGSATPRQKFALIISISHYADHKLLPDLDGPGPDRDAIVQTLISDYDFPSKNVFILSDAQATRANILEALDKLITLVNPGDYVFIYYSGHGTSPAGWEGLPIDGDTGALFPADFQSGSMAEVVSRLVVGKRDIRPRLLQLDAKATVFAILDTCFSQNSMKSVRPRGTSKAVDLSQAVTSRSGPITRSNSMAAAMARDAQADTSSYPYQNVAWISAALAGQSAVDIDKRVLAQDPNATVDGQPHGALTNSVLIGLRGAADANHDGVITHAELYDFLQHAATVGTWSHQPAWSANDNNHQLPADPVLGGRNKPLETSAIAAPAGSVTVCLEGGAAGLAASLAHQPGISLVSGTANLLVRPESGGYRIYQQGVVPITEKPLSEQETLARILAEPDVRTLLNWASPSQHARMQLELHRAIALGNDHYQVEPQATHQGVLFEGQTFALSLKRSQPVWPLVVNIDVTGYVTVLYPLKTTDDTVSREETTQLGVDGIKSPFGVEFLKAVAFAREPQGYKDWAGQEFPATDPRFQQLMKLVQQSMADTTTRLITQSKDQQ